MSAKAYYAAHLRDTLKAETLGDRYRLTGARAQHAIPILVTPLTRRQFENGQLQSDLAPSAEAARRVAAELCAPLLDLNARGAAPVQALGPVGAARPAETVSTGEVAPARFIGAPISGDVRADRGGAGDSLRLTA